MQSRDQQAPKLSAALLELSQPLIDYLPPQATLKQIESVAQIGQLVWNAVVLERIGRPSGYVEDARAAIRTGLQGPGAEAMVALISDLEDSKRGESSQDQRLIGKVEAYVDSEGVIRLRASQVALPPAIDEL